MGHRPPTIRTTMVSGGIDGPRGVTPRLRTIAAELNQGMGTSTIGGSASGHITVDGSNFVQVDAANRVQVE